MGVYLTKSEDLGRRRRRRPSNVNTNTRTITNQLPSYHISTTRVGGTDDSNNDGDEAEIRPADNLDHNTSGNEVSRSHQTQNEPPLSKVENATSTRQHVLEVQQCQAPRTIEGNITPPVNDNAPPSYTSLNIEDNCATLPGPPKPSTTSGIPAEPDDPLVAAARHNQAQPFHSLPDFILLYILSHLDDTGVECLRRVARRFPPLAAEVVRARDFFQGDKNVPHRRGPFPWPRLCSIQTEGSAEVLELLRLLDRDRYCAGCLRARKAPDWLARVKGLRHYLECSFCLTAHPACLFSPEQRRQGDHKRRCIAEKGYVRICSHERGIVRWTNVLDMLRAERRENPPPFNGWRCWHRSHRTECGGGDRDNRAEELSAHCVVPEMDDRKKYPAFYILKSDDPTKEEEKSLCMEWQAHIPLGRLGEWPPTASSLRRHLTELRNNAGRFINMTTQPVIRQLPEFRCFDPNDCDCVYFEGSEHVDWRPYRPLQQRDILGNNTGFSKCYLDPARRLVSFPLRRRLSPATGDRHERLSSGPIRMCQLGAAQCLMAEKGHMTRYTGPQSDFRHGPGLNVICASLCHSESPCIRVSYRRMLATLLPDAGPLDVPASWYLSLDPDSYGLTSDAEGYGLYWCREPQCCNYYRGSPGFNRLILGYKHLQGEEAEACLEDLDYHY